MIEVRKGRLTASITLILSLLTLRASLQGLLNENVYGDVLSTGIFSEAARTEGISL